MGEATGGDKEGQSEVTLLTWRAACSSWERRHAAALSCSWPRISCSSLCRGRGGSRDGQALPQPGASSGRGASSRGSRTGWVGNGLVLASSFPGSLPSFPGQSPFLLPSAAQSCVPGQRLSYCAGHQSHLEGSWDRGRRPTPEFLAEQVWAGACDLHF